MGCRDDNLSFFIDFPFLLLAAQLPDISNARLVEKLRPDVDTKARRVKKAGKCRSGDKHHSVVINKKDLALPRRPRGQREQHEASRNTAGEGEFEARYIRGDRLWLRQVGDREVLPGEVEKRAHDSGNIPARPGKPDRLFNDISHKACRRFRFFGVLLPDIPPQSEAAAT